MSTGPAGAGGRRTDQGRARRAGGRECANENCTGLTQIVGQLRDSNRDFQSKFWAKACNLGQPGELEPFNVRLAIKAARLAAALGDGAAGEAAALLRAAAAAVDGLAAAEALPPHDLADLAGGVRRVG